MLAAMEMCLGKVAPDTVSYNSVLKVCGKAGRIQQALNVRAPRKKTPILDVIAPASASVPVGASYLSLECLAVLASPVLVKERVKRRKEFLIMC